MTFNDYMIQEGKLEDFIEGNKLSKADAMSDDNIAKLKKILKISPDKTKARVEKYFKSHPEDAHSDSKAEDLPKVPDDVRDEVEKLPEEKRGLFKSILGIITKAAKNYAADKAGKLLDELFMGNFKDALASIYEKRAGAELDDDNKVSKAISSLKEFDGYKKALKHEELKSRKDEETSTEVDESSAKFMAMWSSKNPEENLGKILSDLVKTVQRSAKKLEDDTDKLKSELKKMKIELTDEQFNICAPILFKMMNDKASEKEIKKTVQELTKKVHESVKSALVSKYGMKILTESKFMISRSERDQLIVESMCKNSLVMEAITQRLVMEGWFGDKLAKLKNSKATEFIKQKSAQLGKKLADVGSKGIQTMTKYSIGPMLQLGGIAIGAITSGLYAELIIKAMDFVERNGKAVKNTFERCATAFANSRGVITKVDYHLTGDEKKTYSMRFYEKEMVWRILNTSDQLKHPSLKYCKSIVNGEFGTKYRERLKKIWDPIFSDAKGGKIDFVRLLEQSKVVEIQPKALQAFQQFADNYDNIVANCIESPKIDTRAQKLKK